MNHPPVCKKCQCEMKPETNGVGLLDMFNPSCKVCPRCGIEAPFIEEGEDGFYRCDNCKTLVIPQERLVSKPYQIWDADLWKCPKCGIEVVLGFASGPISHQYEGEDLTRVIKAYESKGKLIKNYAQ